MLPRTSFLLLLAAASLAQAQPISLQGTPLIAQVLKVAEPFLKEELGIELRVQTEGGSNGGFLAVGSGTAQLGMITKMLDPSDRAQFPACAFDEVQIGWQVLGIGVANDVWGSGVHALTRDQMIKIYEGDIQNWKQVGGLDAPIKFYNPKRGRGTWELLATWLYKDQRLAPLGDKFETVVRYEDARDSVEFNVSSISVMPPQMADGKSIHIIGIKEPDGSITEPTPAMLASKKYPLAKPLMILSPRRYAGDAKRLVDFLRTPRGQAMVKSVGFVPVGEVAPKIEADPKEPPAAQMVPPGRAVPFRFSGSLITGLVLGVVLLALVLAIAFRKKPRRLRYSNAAK